MTVSLLPIETPRLLLRNFERDDYDGLCTYQPLREMQRYLEWPVRDNADVLTGLNLMRRQVALQRPGDTLSLAIVRKRDRHLTGQISLRWSDATAGQGEVRFAIDPRYWNNGYASEAVTAVLDMAFDHFKIHRVSARCDGRNHRSAKLLQKLGMRLEAHYREHAMFQGEWDEELHFAILDREWRRSNKVRELPVRRPRVA
jgi:RimJ/RimL family protein N-acetyltransferase